jgi:hypothetical protein
MSIRAYRRPYVKPRNRLTRAKTFSSEESAKAYAEKEGIKKFTLENLKNPESKVMKLRIVSE